MKQKFNGGGTVWESPHQDVGIFSGGGAGNKPGGFMDKPVSSQNVTSAWGNNPDKDVGIFSGSSIPNQSQGNPHGSVWTSPNQDVGNFGHNNSSTNIGFNNNDSFNSSNKDNVFDGNELSILDQISEQNAASKAGKIALQKAKEKQNTKKKVWGLQKFGNDNLNGGSVDTSDGVVDDNIELYDAAKEMALLLGLDPTNQKDLRIALNYLSGDEWGSQAKLKNAQNAAAINSLKSRKKDKDGNVIQWKTWGTRLRGDAAWKGIGPVTKDRYSELMKESFEDKYEVGSEAWKYQRALINSHKPLRSENGFGNLIGQLLMPAFLKGEGVKNWLNEWNQIDEIGVDENGIFNFEMYDDKLNVNEKSPFSKMDLLSMEVEDYEPDNQVGGNYQTYSYDNTGAIAVTEEEDEEEDETQVAMDDDNPAWYDFTLFTKIFTGQA